MKNRLILLGIGGLGLVLTLAAQNIVVELTKRGDLPAIAVPDFRGTGEAQRFMDVFNQTLFADLQGSGVLKMVPKTLYPLQVPQQPNDFKQPVGGTKQGPWLTDWSGAPVNARYLAFGYTAIQNDRLALFGWLYDATQENLNNAQVLGKVYLGTIDEAGARRVAQEFAADILAQFGAKSLLGSKIFFVSSRTGTKEIWSMNYDGSEQRAMTSYRSISTFPAVSPDGTKVAFTNFSGGQPVIRIHSTATNRRLPFYNQNASMNATAEFAPDGQRILFSSTLSGGFAQIYSANMDGSGLKRLTQSRAIEVEPKVNPKTGADVVFVSGRSGPPQLYKMTIEGADVVRLTTGEGEAVNPAWHPDGQHIAFSWTRGFAPGNFNIFVMDVATQRFEQLTHGAGRNENPSWAPDGRHLVFSSNRGGSTQIWTMLADGTQLKQLTTQGANEKPVWSKQ